MRVEMGLYAELSEGRPLIVQKLPADTCIPCKAIGDTCPLPGDWIVYFAGDDDPSRGKCAFACHEHMPSMLWGFCVPDRRS